MFEIHVDVDSLKIDSVDPVFVAGEVWVELNGQDFPGEKWTDSPLSVIGSLGTAIERLREGWVAVDMYFFEGPYFVKLSRVETVNSEEMVRVTFLRDYWSESDSEYLGEVIADENVPRREVEESYRRAVGRLVSWGEGAQAPELLSLLRRMSRS